MEDNRTGFTQKLYHILRAPERLTSEFEKRNNRDNESALYYIPVIGVIVALMLIFVFRIAFGLGVPTSFIYSTIIYTVYLYLAGFILISKKKYRSTESINAIQYTMKERLMLSFKFTVAGIIIAPIMLLILIVLQVCSGEG
jgi:hypothetical protein